MRNILFTFAFCAAIIFSAGCTNKQGSTQPTLAPTETGIAYPIENVETVYPPLSEGSSNPENIEMAYPSLNGDNATPLPIGVVPPAPKEAPQPDPGKASISGVLYSYTMKQAIPETGFYLLPAVGPEKKGIPSALVAPDASKGAIISRSDAAGNISIKDIPPGNYYLVVWAPMNWTIAQISEQDTTPMLLELNDGSRTPLGVIYISWP